MSKLNERVAIVTGASKGIGAGIAAGLAAAGAAVVVNYVKDKDGADRVVAGIVERGGKALAIQADVSNAADVQRLFAHTKAHLGRLDILVNNAGVYQFGPVESVTEEDFHRHYNANVLSVFLTIQEALKHFGAAGGSIINIVTAGVDMNPAYGSLYISSKSAVATMTRILAKELGARHIRVNAIAPGGTETEGSIASGFIGSGMDTQMIGATPLGRLGAPSDIAPAAVFLASDDAAWVTGDILFASGGLR